MTAKVCDGGSASASAGLGSYSPETQTGCVLMLAFVGLVGCGATAKSLGPEHAAVSGTEAVLIGELGARDWGDARPLGWELTVRAGGGGRHWGIDFSEEMTRDGGVSAPFFAVLPAGGYDVADWRLALADANVGSGRGLTDLRLAGGEVLCVGTLFPIKVQLGGIQMTEMAADERSCADLGKLLARRAPNLRPEARIRSALSALMVTAPESTSVHLAHMGGLFLRVGFRNGGSSGPTPGGSLLGRPRVAVCVSDQGGVSKVRVLDPTDPATDSRLVEIARQWRYRPFILGGRPAGFCYVHGTIE